MNSVFNSMVAFRSENVNLTGHGEPQRLSVREVTAGLFPTLGVEPTSDNGRQWPLFLPAASMSGSRQLNAERPSFWIDPDSTAL